LILISSKLFSPIINRKENDNEKLCYDNSTNGYFL